MKREQKGSLKGGHE